MTKVISMLLVLDRLISYPD